MVYAICYLYLMVGRAAYNELLEENHWMDKETRMVAKEKVRIHLWIFETIVNLWHSQRIFVLISLFKRTFGELRVKYDEPKKDVWSERDFRFFKSLSIDLFLICPYGAS